MLGREIQDPDGIEEKGTVQGLGLLPVCTVFGQEKRRTRVEGKFRDMGGILKELQGIRFNGYEIHMGRSEVDTKSDRLVSMRKKETKNHRDIMRMGPRTEMSMAVMYMVFLMKNWCQKELFLLY